MEVYIETCGYIACDDTQKIVLAIEKMLVAERMVPIEKAPSHIYAECSMESNYWSVAVIPGVPGWHLILSAPKNLFCECGHDERARFVALCEELKAPGFIREISVADEDLDRFGRITLEVDAAGNSYICGLMSFEEHGYETAKNVKWNGYEMNEDNMEKETIFIHQHFPEKIDLGQDDFHANFEEMRRSRELALRLAGPHVLAHWDGSNAWHGLVNALVSNLPFPIQEAVVKTFQWPPLDRSIASLENKNNVSVSLRAQEIRPKQQPKPWWQKIIF